MADDATRFTFPAINPYTQIYAPNQSAIIAHNQIYYIFGSEDNSVMLVVDLTRKQIVSSVNFSAIGLNKEPESVFFYEDKIGVSFNSSGQIVLMKFY